MTKTVLMGSKSIRLSFGSSKKDREPAWGGVYVGPASSLSLAQQQLLTQKRQGRSISTSVFGGGTSPTRTSPLAYSARPKQSLQYATSLHLFSGGGSSAAAQQQPIAEVAEPSTSLSESSRVIAAEAVIKKITTGKVKCEICKKKCKGDILKADEKFFHIACFTCKTCKKSLSETGYFVHGKDYYCPGDYHGNYGSKCSACNRYVEGEVVQCMGKTFHQNCFKCDRCRQPFSAGQKATFTAREHLCPKCASIPVATVKPTQSNLDERRPVSSVVAQELPPSPTACAACNQTIHAGQILVALDTQWHIWCFKCTTCGSVLHGEYMAKDGLPYCVRDYNAQFGVRCHECDEYIAGKVLQAGGYHFHPACALCTRCSMHFEENEEMYVQGDEIWHARCNATTPQDRILHRYSTLPTSLSSNSRFLDSFSSYSHSLPRSPRSSACAPKYSYDFGKFLTYMYLLPEGNVSYLKQPISPHPPQTQQFHMPQGKSVKLRKSRVSMFKSGLQKLAEILDEQQPRPRSPHMNNEEPIEMSHFPSARAPEPHEIPPIERDDFPAPPYPYAVEELKRRLSSSDLENEEDEDLVDGNAVQKIKKAEEQLTKIEKESSIAKVFAQNLEEKIKKSKSPLYYDPRSASRTPSAKKLPLLKCRYESPINASPSRYLSRPRPWEYWEKNRAVTATIPYPYYMQVPKPGYGLAPKAASLPGSYGYYYYDFHTSDLDTTRSSTLSDKSIVQTPIYSDYGRFQPSYGASMVRTSLPDMSKPPKIYPYGTLLTVNKKLPEDVDRCHLERHLNKDEFQKIFSMMPIEFYRLPEWKRINLKRLYKLY